MFESLVETFATYPYLGVAVVFVICGLGFPLPEELVLIAAGYVSFKELASVEWMMVACAASILAGDLPPFLLGRIFGARLLRWRPLRLLVNRRRLAQFDNWFRRRGDLVIFFARFITGVRIVAYFTAGTMKMRVSRFIMLDVLGILVVVPLFVGIGYSAGTFIDDAIAKVQQVERGILIAVGASLVVVLVWWLWRRRRRARIGASKPVDRFVKPSTDDSSTPPADADEGPESDPPSDPEPDPPSPS